MWAPALKPKLAYTVVITARRNEAWKLHVTSLALGVSQVAIFAECLYSVSRYLLAGPIG